jgi:hypothetical protein
MFGSNGANLEHSVTTIDQSLLQSLDTGILETPNEAVTRRHLDALSPSIHEPSHGLHQAMDFQPRHGGMNRESKEPSILTNINDIPRHVVTHRIDEVSPRAGHDDGGVAPCTNSRKRRAPEGSFPSKIHKKRQIEPPTNVPHVHELSPSLPPSRSSEEFEPSRGGRKSNVRPLSIMRKEDYYYAKNTSLDDQTYFGDVIEKLRAAAYLRGPQGHEPTISSPEGVALVGESRTEGPGRAREDEPVYAILIDKPSSGPFRCWICGHLEKQRKVLRALGHIREHFEHRPWECTQDHHVIREVNGDPTRRRVKKKDGPW